MVNLVSKELIQKAFKLLDDRVTESVTLILGGGACMILAHGYPLATTDVDAIPQQLSFDQLDGWVKEIARELHLPGDWLNPYFSTFTFVLPKDYATRLVDVFGGRRLRVRALGREDMLILKCFAHRPKDVGHARALLKLGVDLAIVTKVIEDLAERDTPNADEALEFLDGLIEERGE
jgi:hypothetical protein